MLSRNDPGYVRFPDANHADASGLLAHGGDLRPKTLLSAYQQGLFPWFDDDQPILWWSPDPRMVLRPKQFKLSRSLRKTLRKDLFSVTCDQSFQGVIQACSEPRRGIEHGTWITSDMQQAYLHLHDLGYAHSIECWQDKKLVGGLYGVCIQNMFFGESMFSRQRDASKVALFYLCRFLQQQQVEWIDCQVASEHLLSLGAENISRDEFLLDLQQGLQQNGKIVWQDFAEATKLHKLDL